MSDFCTMCAPDEQDISIVQEFAQADEGNYCHVLCEGCGMVFIGRFDDKCVVHFGKHASDKSRICKWFEYDLDTNELGKEFNVFEYLDKKWCKDFLEILRTKMSFIISFYTYSKYELLIVDAYQNNRIKIVEEMKDMLAELPDGVQWSDMELLINK